MIDIPNLSVREGIVKCSEYNCFYIPSHSSVFVSESCTSWSFCVCAKTCSISENRFSNSSIIHGENWRNLALSFHFRVNSFSSILLETLKLFKGRKKYIIIQYNINDQQQCTRDFWTGDLDFQSAYPTEVSSKSEHYITGFSDNSGSSIL